MFTYNTLNLFINVHTLYESKDFRYKVKKLISTLSLHNGVLYLLERLMQNSKLCYHC